MTTAKPTGVCPACGRTYALTSAGTIRNHKQPDATDYCPGSRDQPAAVTKPVCTCGEGTATLHWSNCQLYTSQLLGAHQPSKEK